MLHILFGIFGLACLIGLAFLFSNNKRAIDWPLVLTGIGLQIGFAVLVLVVPGGKDVFDALGHGFVRILGFVNAGRIHFRQPDEHRDLRLHLRVPVCRRSSSSPR